VPDRDPTDDQGLTFRPPLQELEETLKKKIQRHKEEGDREAADLYAEVLELARKMIRADEVDEQEETSVLTHSE
jgi:hypothetical protein